MSKEGKDLVDLVKTCLVEVAEQDGLDLPNLETETEIFGEGGFLDSAALVMLVTVVEEAIEEELGVTVSLTDERAMSQTRSPFQSIAALADYAKLRIDDEQGDG